MRRSRLPHNGLKRLQRPEAPAAIGSTARATTTTGGATRLWRVSRLALHLAQGLALARFVYPRRPRDAQLAMIRVWSGRLLAILGIAPRIRDHGALPVPCMVVANHVSWLDIFVINSRHPVRFVAKSEVRGWPLIGPLCAMTGTVFIERIKRRDAHRINEVIGEALADGDRVAVFPEGVTSHGDVVQHFHANLLQAAVDRACPLQPVALRYLDCDGARCAAAAYVGDQSFAASLLAILAEPAIIAEAEFLAPVMPRGHPRRELARITETAISGALGLPVVHRKPGTPSGPPA